MDVTLEAAERGLFPDFLLRAGMRRLLRERLREEDRGGCEANQAALETLVEELRRSPIAISTRRANEQHYEVPDAFFRLVLGPRMKYSCCLWEPGTADLASAEDAMLRLTAERAGIEDGQDVLELGCGWGSLTLWMAERYPNSRITAVSNSSAQRRFIERAAADKLRDNKDFSCSKPDGDLFCVRVSALDNSPESALKSFKSAAARAGHGQLFGA